VIHDSFSRRHFLSRAAATTAVAALAPQLVDAAGTPNPFAYDVSKLERTDPKLIGYVEDARWNIRLPSARRIAVGPENRILVAADNAITTFTADGGRVSEIATIDAVRCMTIAGDGGVFAGLRGTILEFDAKGQKLKSWDVPDKKAWLTGLAASGNDLFAADSGNRIVWHFDRSGKLLGRIGGKNEDRNIPGFVVPSPYLDVKIHRDGLLRVNNPGRHRVEAYTFGGDFEGSWGKPSAAIEGFCGCCNPISIALLPDGRFVTAEKGVPRVKVYGLQGDFECVAAGAESFTENARAGGGGGFADAAMAGLDVAVDSRERLIILDRVTSEIRVMKRKA
jgi:hypothetical protein